MTSIRLTDPAVEPVTLDEMKAHLRLTTADEDETLEGFVKAARLHVEQSTRRALIQQQWRIYLDGWPVSRIVKLPVSPVISVDEVTVFDPDGNPSALSGEDYRLDRSARPERLRIRLGAGLPASQMTAAEVDFTAGYGLLPEAVPQDCRQAIRLLAAHWFERREAGGDAAMMSLPHGLDRLLSTARVPLL